MKIVICLQSNFSKILGIIGKYPYRAIVLFRASVPLFKNWSCIYTLWNGWKCRFFYFKKSANIIRKNVPVLLKHSDRNICTLRRFTWTYFSYLFINFFNSNFIETVLGLFLYFNIAVSIGLESLSPKGLVSLNLVILRFLTAFEKKIFKSSAFCSSCVVTVSSSAKVIFSFDLVLSENKGLTVVQNCLVSTLLIIFYIQVCIIIFFGFS